MLPTLALVPLLVSSLAPSVSAATIPFGRSTAARRELDLAPRNATLAERNQVRIVTDPKTGKSRRLVRRKKNHWNNNKSTSCGDSSASATPTDGSASASATGGSSSSSGGDDGSWSPSSSASAPSSSSSGGSSTLPSENSSSEYKLLERAAGEDFWSHWNFWSWDDPTHGTVEYLDQGAAESNNLIDVVDGKVIMRVDTTQQVSGGRKSVRIHSNRSWNKGLVLMDAEHMPTGCATWPAWWQNGPNWPEGGEIDILEGVNDDKMNQVSLHTGQGCTMPQNINDGQIGKIVPSNGFDAFDCSSANTANQGCGVQDQTNTDAYGPGFNSNNGGVYATLVEDEGIKIWWFPRGKIPQDITDGSPNPSSWGTPVGNYPSTSCDMTSHFYDMINIFDTTLCGDWAGGAWGASCAASTGYDSCSDYVLNNGDKFKEAYWTVNYVSWYSKSG